MGKINFLQPKNQFPRAEIRFLLKILLPPYFKLIKRALNKTILILLERKFVFTSRNEEFVTKNVALGRNCFHFLEYLVNGKKMVFHQPEKQFLLGKIKFFCKNWLPHNFNYGYHQQKEYYNTKKILFHLYRKRFYSFCFRWWKLLLKLGRAQFFKNNLLPVSGNWGESSF